MPHPAAPPCRVATAGSPAHPRRLYFPAESHGVLTPGDAKVWYETVLAFLAVHVLDEPEQTPELLR